MGWKDMVGDAGRKRRKRKAGKEQLSPGDDLRTGLTALREELVQSRLEILELLQGGVTGLREENREVRRRQDRMISGLDRTREGLRELLDLVDVLRPLAPTGGPGEKADDGVRTHPGKTEPESGAGAEYGSAGPAAAHPAASPDHDSQEGTMETTERRPQPVAGNREQDLALRNAIEATYRSTGASGARSSAAAPQASADVEDPQVAHGVLLLKAAGVASAELIVHRDAWEWLAALAVGQSHFRTPPAVEDFSEGRIRTVLSGRSLIALLIELWNTRSTAAPLQGDWAMAVTSYDRIAAGLSDVTGQGETIRIVLDDGLPHETDD